MRRLEFLYLQEGSRTMHNGLLNSDFFGEYILGMYREKSHSVLVVQTAIMRRNRDGRGGI